MSRIKATIKALRLSERRFVGTEEPKALFPPPLPSLARGSALGVFRRCQRRVLIALIDCRNQGEQDPPFLPRSSFSSSSSSSSRLPFRSLDDSLRLIIEQLGEPLRSRHFFLALRCTHTVLGRAALSHVECTPLLVVSRRRRFCATSNSARYAQTESGRILADSNLSETGLAPKQSREPGNS